MLNLKGTHGTTLAIADEGERLTFSAGVVGTELRDSLDAGSVASLAIGLLGWLNRQPAYEGLGLEIAWKHLEAKVRQARQSS